MGNRWVEIGPSERREFQAVVRKHRKDPEQFRLVAYECGDERPGRAAKKVDVGNVRAHLSFDASSGKEWLAAVNDALEKGWFD